MNRLLIALIIALLFSPPSYAVPSEAAIASAHPLATEAGISILKQGGNAFDAAVSVIAVLAVVEPYSSGLGGGGFLMLHTARNNRDIMVDARERAPFAASRDMFLDEDGVVIPGASIDGPLAAGIPGVPAVLEHLAVQYGNLPLSKTLQPAIEYAKNGFEIDDHYRKMINFRLATIQSSWAAAEIFLDDDQVPEKGYRLIQSDLAKTLQHIAYRGANGFYQGDVARKLVSAVREAGGIWTLEDLNDYGVVERWPITGYYDGMKITSAAPPSSGGIAIVEMLNMLSALGYEESDRSHRVHLVTEAMRRAYRDRAEYLGDTDYIKVPVEKLTSKAYAKNLLEDLSESKATRSSSLKSISAPSAKSVDTTHFSIIDGRGNRVAATLSVNYPFGSGFVAEGTGVLLNDEMDDFSIKPNQPNVYGLVGGLANAIEPGKRMLSSMSPTFLETKDRIAVVGTPGGSRIITMVLLAALTFHQSGSAQEMVDLPRFHHQYLPDKLFYEPAAFDEKVKKSLSRMGHALEELESTYGNMQIVVKDKNSGRVTAASDSRGMGSSSVLH